MMSGILSSWIASWGDAEEDFSREDFEALYEKSISRNETGDLEGAIRCLREALDAAHASRHIVTTLEQHLLLAHFLMEVGRYDEARERFEALLAHGYPGQLLNPNVEWVERGITYNMMRHGFERAGRAREAVVYGVLSFVAHSYGHFLDSARFDYEEDMERIRARGTHEAMAEAVLPPSVRTLSRHALADVLGGAVSRFGSDPIDRIIEDVESCLREKLRRERR